MLASPIWPSKDLCGPGPAHMNSFSSSDPLAKAAPQTSLHTPSLNQSHSGPIRDPFASTLKNTLIPRDYLSSSSKTLSSSEEASVLPKVAAPISPADTRKAKLASRAGPAVLDTARDMAKSQEDLTQGRDSSQNPNNSGIHVERSKPTIVEVGPNKETPAVVFPDSPKSFASSTTSEARQNLNMPRTSSIDSAISSLSTPSQIPKTQPDGREPTVNDIRNLIALAGSAENLVQHLLRDKNHAAAQNAQLWKLVDKQRSVLLGLNRDLERLTKEKDRYKKKLKDVQAQLVSNPSEQQMIDTQSPQSQHLIRDYTTQTSETIPQNDNVQTKDDPAMIPSPLRPQRSNSSGLLATISEPVENKSDQLDVPAESSKSLPSITTHSDISSEAVTDTTPLSDKPPKSFQASRKSAPKPLDLKPSRSEMLSPEQALSDTELDMPPEHIDRGRRRTREEDDRDREIAAKEEMESRSQSKKNKTTKNESSQNSHHTPSPHSLPLQKQDDPSPAQPSRAKSLAENSLSLPMSDFGAPRGSVAVPLRSPGLPATPRPVDRPMGSPLPGFMKDGQPVNTLPMSPRFGSMSLSPRAPKQPLPAPSNLGSLAARKQSAPSPLANVDIGHEVKQPTLPEPPSSPRGIPPIYRGLVSPTWPDFLLPPNALPSIQVRVASSRLRPSRHSVMLGKNLEDSIVFSLSIYARANNTELWRLEKMPASLPVLDQQLRPKCPQIPKIPERKLFNGQSPAILDARRAAIDTYFDELLDTPMDEQAAAIICQFLSTDVVDPEIGPQDSNSQATMGNGSEQKSSHGKPRKMGYLTKKGKNFGGWKSRYFVLDSPELRYFEAIGGAHLGTIKLLNARIGRQTQSEAVHDDTDAEHQFRHAFLILEPKRKDSTSYVRHVLCAESDEERDGWVETLLYYVDERSAYEQGIPTPATSVKTPSLKGDSRSIPSINHPENGNNPSPNLASPDLSQSHSNSPSTASSNSIPEPVMPEQSSGHKQMNISGPMNGAPIADAGVWGNRNSHIPPMAASSNKDRADRKRSIFQFKKQSHEQLPNPQPIMEEKARQQAQHAQSRPRGPVRPVFGMPLAEAVEFCAPEGVNVYLPAIVYRCIEYLRAKNAASEEGLFRLSGSSITVRTLKERFNAEGDVDLLGEGEYYDVHAVVSLFKNYLRDLPSTILTRDLHVEFLKVLELSDKAEKVEMFHELVYQLPAPNFSLLRTLSQYLLEVVQNASKNKMSVKNVGIIFSPTLNIPAPVLSMFLTEYEAIFEGSGHEDRGDQSNGDNQIAGSRAPDETSRHQMRPNASPPNLNDQGFSRSGPTLTPGNTYGNVSPGIGFVPIQPSYETRTYVTNPQQDSSSQYQQMENNGNYRLLAPNNTSNAKAKRRESAMLFVG